MTEISWSDFQKVDIRVGTVTRVEDFPEAKNPAFKLWIDFGDLGQRKTSAQITKRYSKEDLIGKQIIAVVNFPPKQIGPFMSEVLVLGSVGNDGDVILVEPDQNAQNGSKIG